MSGFTPEEWRTAAQVARRSIFTEGNPDLADAWEKAADQAEARLVPAGGMALTAEQVGGLKFALEAVTSVADVVPELRGTLSTPISRLVKFLCALFPSTEPAAVRDGSDLVVVQRSHTAKAVQSWMTLDLWTDLGKNDKDFDAEYERQGFGDLWATLLGEVRALVQAITPAPAEPAEKETKAETLSVRLGRAALEASDAVNYGSGLEAFHLAVGEAILAELALTSDTKVKVVDGCTCWPEDRTPDCYVSSPVVPAPTETGPWA